MLSALLSILLSFHGSTLAADRPLLHSHNDYLRSRPLADALEHDFDSIEADVYLVDGRLLVAHNERELDGGRELEGMYLAPLDAWARQQGGRVRASGKTLVLLIDQKSEAVATYRALEALLARYETLLTVYEGGRTRPGAVSVLISGNRPRAAMASQSRRLAALDGGVSELALGAPVDLVPWISLDWKTVSEWRGFFPMPTHDRRGVAGIARQAAEQGRRFRVWNAPDRESAWSTFWSLGVDVLHTDHLTRLKRLVDSRD